MTGINNINEKNKECALLFQFRYDRLNPFVSIKNTNEQFDSPLGKLNIFDDKGIIEMFHLDSRTVFYEKNNPNSLNSVDKTLLLLDEVLERYVEIKLKDYIKFQKKEFVDFSNKIEEKLFIYYDKKICQYSIYIHIDLIDFAFEKSSCKIKSTYSNSKYLSTKSYYHINNNLVVVKKEKLLYFKEFIDIFRDDFDLIQEEINDIFFYSNDCSEVTLTKLHNKSKNIEDLYKKIEKLHNKKLNSIMNNWDTTQKTTINIII